ncbi:hypothetical protein IQ260_10495 [Leptolyngbya cf. ectocarpi LEGE 11479]|uniref:Uncharacterized protein n=1 Tax=Leptolyngbya cf. ectocarpi LEGE 11479 TaxID=1828722 RepID=A0A928X4J9_LEPEC|nr:hypothetical protein [Leptolyngbya ectocarpi]MBE9067083.1 hypothetical protein [Leptolyngbya cf. ectocarpi LEGE 11479]
MEPYSSDISGEQAADIEEIRLAVQIAAQKRENNCEALLALLRQLEGLHRDIRETLFQESLPTNRQHLYNLLKDIELHGGWPYIQRMKLMDLLVTLESPIVPDTSEE